MKYLVILLWVAALAAILTITMLQVVKSKKTLVLMQKSSDSEWEMVKDNESIRLIGDTTIIDTLLFNNNVDTVYKTVQYKYRYK